MKGKEEPPGELTTRGLQKENRLENTMHDVLNNGYFWVAVMLIGIFGSYWAWGE